MFGDSNLNYRYIGNTSLYVSELCYGTMTFGASTDVKKSETIFNAALDAGINFFDTAEVYGGDLGFSEEILGKVMKGKRDKIILSSKVHGFEGHESHQSRTEIIKTVEQSLKRLNTDYIDIYFLHWADPYVRFEEKISALNELVQAGKIRYLGTSNHEAWLVEKMNLYAIDHNLAPISLMQEIYNPIDYDVSQEKFSLAKDSNLGIMVYSPLAGGFLTGKYEQNKSKPKGSRGAINMDWESKRWKFRFSDYGFEMLELLKKISKKNNATIAQTALSYLLSFSEFSSIIIGAKTSQQLEENLRTYILHEEDIKKIQTLSFFI